MRLGEYGGGGGVGVGGKGARKRRGHDGRRVTCTRWTLCLHFLRCVGKGVEGSGAVGYGHSGAVMRGFCISRGEREVSNHVHCHSISMGGVCVQCPYADHHALLDAVVFQMR